MVDENYIDAFNNNQNLLNKKKKKKIILFSYGSGVWGTWRMCA